MRTCAKCNHDCHEDAVSLRAALAAKDAEIERLKQLSRDPDDVIMLNQQQTKIIEQEQIIAAKDAEIERLKKDADAGLGRAVRAMPETCVWTVSVTENSWILGCDESKDTSAPPKVCPYCKKRVEVKK